MPKLLMELYSIRREGKIFTPRQAIDAVRQIEHDMPRMQEAMREIMRRLTPKT